MAQIYFVNINTSADSITSGTGSEQSCFTYSQFRTSLSTNDETDVPNYYYLKGYRNITTSGESITPLSADNIWMLSKKNVYINSWDSDPWKINFVNDFYLESYVDWFTSINFQNGFIKTSQLNLKFSIDSAVSATFENCWIDAIFDDSNTGYSGGFVNFVNCTLNNFKLNNKNFNTFSFINTIIYNSTNNNYYLFNNTTYTYVSFDNIVSNRYINNQSLGNQYNIMNPSIPYGEGVTYEITSNITPHENWNTSAISATTFSAAISAISQSNLDYTLAGWNTISAIGNKSYNNLFWGESARDGIGALYFPYIKSNFLVNGSSPSSATLQTLVNFTWDNNLFGIYLASAATLNYDDYITSSFTTTSAVSSTYRYNYNIGTATPTLQVYSKNGWYSVTSGVDLTLNTPLTVSANIKTLDSLSASIISAHTNDLILISAYSLTSGVYDYSYDYGNGVSSTNTSITEISAIPITTNTYSLADFYNIKLILNDSLPSISPSANILIQREYRDYYVDIDTSVSAGSGTSGIPFNYDQFYDRVKTDGTGIYGDTYNLKNLRVISSATPFEIDKTKNFLIKAWDTSAFGPWILVLDGTIYNVSASFAGSTLKDGIIYNKPFNYFLNYIGTNISFTNLYDVFIVSNGNNSQLIIDPYNYVTSSTTLSGISGTYLKEIQYTSAVANFIGSTIYVPSGTSAIADNTTSGYNLYLIDSVLSNFISSAGTLSSCSATIYNCAFNANGSSATFIVIINNENQYNWVAPVDVDYPFNILNIMYGKDMNYINANTKMLRPFSGISATPNPGHGYDTYPNYETGLFGYSRKNYVRND